MKLYFILAYCGFLQVKEFLEHFWKGVPLHFMGILGTNAVVNMVGVCDSILYRSIAGILVPSTHKVSLLAIPMYFRLLLVGACTYMYHRIFELNPSHLQMLLHLKSSSQICIDNHVITCMLGLVNNFDDNAELMIQASDRYRNLCHIKCKRGTDLSRLLRWESANLYSNSIQNF
jgi:hypothetical protein